MTVLGRRQIAEIDEARGDGWAELQPNRPLKGQIRLHNRQEPKSIARPETSSTAC